WDLYRFTCHTQPTTIATVKYNVAKPTHFRKSYSTLNESTPSSSSSSLSPVSTKPPKANLQTLISDSFQLSKKVSKYLNSSSAPTMESFERLLTSSFRTNVQDDPLLKDTLTLFESTSTNVSNLSMSPNSIIISLDTGGESLATDFGLCIYDVRSQSVLKIHVGIIGMMQSKRSKDVTKLMSSPLKLQVAECKKLLRLISRYYFDLRANQQGMNILIVGHNLEKDLKSLGLLGFHVPANIAKLDTEHLARHIISNNFKWKSSQLRKVAIGLGITESKPFHPSVNDAYYTLLVLLRLLGTQSLEESDFVTLSKEYQIYEKKLKTKLQKFWIKTKLLQDELFFSSNEIMTLHDGTVVSKQQVKRLMKKIRKDKQLKSEYRAQSPAIV
ncbi:hypothetical protein WICPIJ_005654, partial [Wickerhamomyces pijperi]